MADVLVLGLAFWGLYTLAVLSQRQLLVEASRWAFVAVLLIPLNAMRLVVKLSSPRVDHLQTLLLKTKLIIVCGVIATVLAWAMVRWRRRIIPALALFVLLLFPFTFFTFGRVLVHWFKARSAAWVGTAPVARAPRTSSPSRQRVLWIIFDEMDERLTFVDRPSGLKLPEIDRLRDESLWASNAFPPGGGTVLSMPSLINGRIVTKTWVQSTGDLLLAFEGDERPVSWRNTENVFSEARRLGYETALVGWTLPYPKLIGGSPDFCQSFPYPSPGSDLPFLSRMLYWSTLVPYSFPLADDLRWLRPIDSTKIRLEARGQIKIYRAFCKAAIPVATNRDFNLVLLHWPIPHQPFIYSRSRGDFDPSGRGTYIDNLALVDQTFGELRRAMEAAGAWDSTTTLVSADHWLRVSAPDASIDHRVPFLLKLAGQTTRLDYTRPFDTVATHDLILAILRGELQDPESVARWLDRRNDPNPFARFAPASPKPAVKGETAVLSTGR
jgi:hypothetical protein